MMMQHRLKLGAGSGGLLGRFDPALVVVVEEDEVADEHEGQEEDEQREQPHLVSHSSATPRSTQ